MQADISAPTPSETRIVIEMTEDEARKLLARSPNFIAHLEETMAKALVSPAVPARANREPDAVTTLESALAGGCSFNVARFGAIRVRSDSCTIGLVLIVAECVRDEYCLSVEKARATAHDMLAACDWAERQAAQRAAAEYQFTGDLPSEAAPIANNQPPEPDPRSPIPAP